jgi:hypothetical protein
MDLYIHSVHYLLMSYYGQSRLADAKKKHQRVACRRNSPRQCQQGKRKAGHYNAAVPTQESGGIAVGSIQRLLNGARRVIYRHTRGRGVGSFPGKSSCATCHTTCAGMLQGERADYKY